LEHRTNVATKSALPLTLAVGMAARSAISMGWLSSLYALAELDDQARMSANHRTVFATSGVQRGNASPSTAQMSVA
jgi:hypothetical protein